MIPSQQQDKKTREHSMRKDTSAADSADRAPRFESHALVDIRTSRWNPFSHISAVLLDISTYGFKIEFVSRVKLRPGMDLTMTVPLSPFHIHSPAKLKLDVVIKWYDSGNNRAGGVFSHIRPEQAYVLENLIASVAATRTGEVA